MTEDIDLRQIIEAMRVEIRYLKRDIERLEKKVSQLQYMIFTMLITLLISLIVVVIE